MLPYKYKLPGYILIATGLMAAILFFSINFRFEIPVFAVVSSYMETRVFTTFRTNITDEVILLILLVGFILVACSGEKDEYKIDKSIRIKALGKTVIVNSLFLVFSIVFIYGSAFLMMSVANLFSPFILYLIFFNYYLSREKRKIKPD